MPRSGGGGALGPGDGAGDGAAALGAAEAGGRRGVKAEGQGAKGGAGAEAREGARGLGASKWKGTIERTRSSKLVVDHIAAQPARARIAGTGALEHADTLTASFLKEKIKDASHYRTLYLFEPGNPFRNVCERVCLHPAFAASVNLAVLANSAVILLQLPRQSDDHPLNAMQSPADLAFTILFSLEMAIKLVAVGAVNHPGSYLRDPWNVLDATIVTLGWVSLAATGVSGFKVLRTFRLLKPLRALSSNKKLRLLISALFLSIADLGSVVALWLLCICVFGAVGMQLWMGRLHARCVAASPPYDFDLSAVGRVCGDNYRCGEGFACLSVDPLTNSKFENPHASTASFDNFGKAAMMVFQAFTLEGFMDVMYLTQDVYGWSVAAYWVFVVTFGSFFVVSLATAVVFNSFQQASERMEDIATSKSGDETPDEQKRPPASPDARKMPPAKDRSQDREPEQKGGVDGKSKPSGRATERVSEEYARAAIAAANAAEHDSADAEHVTLTIADQPRPTVDSDVAPTRQALSRLRSHKLDLIVSFTFDETTGQPLATTLSDPRPPSQPPLPPPSLTPSPLTTKTNGGANAGALTEAAKKPPLPLTTKTNGGANAGALTEAAKEPPSQTADADEGGDDNDTDGTLPPFHDSSGIVKVCAKIAHDKSFDSAIVLVIALNSICLASEYYGMSSKHEDILEYSNIVFLVIFTFECAVKVVGLGPHAYFRDYSNAFDFTIVAVSLLEVGLPLPPGLSVLRSFRLLRMVRLLRQFEGAQMVIRITQMSVPYIFSFSLILALVLFIVDAFGVTFLGKKDLCIEFECAFDSASTPKVNGTDQLLTEPRCTSAGGTWQCMEPLPQSFRNFYWGFLTVFQVITGENWHVVYQGATAVGGWSFSFYFVAILLIGNYILLNLFLAAVLANVEIDFAEKDKEEQEKRSHEHVCEDHAREETVMRIDAVDAELAERKTKALWILPLSSPLRKSLARLAQSKPFDYVITAFIVLSCVAVSLDNPHQPQGEGMRVALLTADGVFAVVFLIEMVMKLAAFGLWNPFFRASDAEGDEHHEHHVPLEGMAAQSWSRRVVNLGTSSLSMIGVHFEPETLSHQKTMRALRRNLESDPNALLPGYIQDSWNILDGVIVIVGVMTFIADLGGDGAAASMKPLRVLRVVRALRPLRLMTHAQGLRKVWMTLVKCIPHVSGVCVLSCAFCFIYAVLGVHLFKGKLHRCTDTSVLTEEACVGTFGPDNAPRAWYSPRPNFDNVGEGLLSTFELVLGEDWDALMYATIDAYKLGHAPRKDANPLAALYCIGFILFGTLFIGNLLVSAVVSHYLRLRNRGELGLLTEEQEMWVKTHRGLLFERPDFQPKRPPARRFFGIPALLYEVVMHPHFDNFIMSMILLNIIVLLSDHDEPSDAFVDWSYGFGLFFTCVFIAEMVIKLIALGPFTYVRDSWNVFDGSVVVIGLVSTIVSAAVQSSAGNPTAVRILRVFRAIRALRAIKVAKGVRMLVRTFILSLPSLYNVGTLILLMYFIFAVLGNNLLGGCDRSNTDEIDERTNFEWFGTSFLLLFRATAGENWNAIMHEYMECTWVASPFFLAHTVFSGFVLLNLFIAIILDNFDEAKFAETSPLDPNQIDHFNVLWREYDPYARESAPTGSVPSILTSLREPLGLKQSDGAVPSKAEVLKIVRDMDIPDHDGFVHYFELLEKLAYRVCGAKLPRKALFNEIKMQHTKFPSIRTMPHAKVDVYQAHAASRIQAAWRGLKERKNIKAIKSAIGEVAIRTRALSLSTETTLGSKKVRRWRSGSKSSKDVEPQRRLSLARSKSQTLTVADLLQKEAGGAEQSQSLPRTMSQ